MKTKTTTREYDDAGNLVKETVYEYEYVAPAAQCVCWQPWHSVTGRTCPVHGYIAPTQIWCGGNISPSSGAYVTYNTGDVGSGTTDRILITA